MNSVTDVIKQVNQPYGGYLPIKMFDCHSIGGEEISFREIPPIIVGKTIDSMLHIVIHSDLEKLFKTSVAGYEKRVEYFARQFSYDGSYEIIEKQIIDEDEIFNVHNLISRVDGYIKKYDFYHLAICVSLIHQYDIWETDFGYIRNRTSIEKSRAKYYTKGDIRRLVTLLKRTLLWISSIKAPNIVFDYKFYPNGYTDAIKYGVGDFVCNKTLFDLKCTKNRPTSLHTLQILVYYVMGLNSGNKLYKNIQYIGIYSPISNKVWTLDVKKISIDLIKEIEEKVLKVK